MIQYDIIRFDGMGYDKIKSDVIRYEINKM